MSTTTTTTTTTEASQATKRSRPQSSSSSDSSSSDSDSSSSGSDSSSSSGSSSSGSSSSGSSSSGSSSSGSSSSGSSSSGSSSSGSSSSGSSSSGSSSSSSDDDSDDDSRGRKRSSKNKRISSSSKSSTKSKSKKDKKEKREKRSLSTMQVNSAAGYAVKTELKPLQPTQGANKWWSRPSLPRDHKWTTLDHNGILFAVDYVPHGVKMLYDGQPVDLTKDQEEIATYYAQALGSEHVTKAKFRENFFNDWKKLLGPNHVIKTMDKCDFKPIRDHLDKEKEAKVLERKTAEYKERTKREKAEMDSIYGTAIVDGFKENVGNYRTEIPSLFRGRGGHPKTGKIKRRVMPEDVILNISKDSPIPKCPIPGHQWKGVIHNPQVTWLAFWKDEITNSFKYVYLASSSRFKGESDRNKYNKARRLHNRIGHIRESYTKDLDSGNNLIAQRATAMYLIDKLALRVGNEKDTSEAADTVGCCSLRVEHIKFSENCTIELDFLGKDSIAYHNEVSIDEKPYRNLKRFCNGKSGSKDIFDELNPTKLNDHLKELMPDLSAKVFRTYNASITLESLLADDKNLASDASHVEKLAFYNDANRAVAILCNHQKAVSKGHSTQMTTMQEKLVEMEDNLSALEGRASEFNGKKLPTDKSKRQDQIIKLEQRIHQHKAKMALKEDNKTVSLGTSKINYMDPRISIAWCKKVELPIEKVFNKSLLSKFPWAMEVPATWKFEDINVSDF